ncbi:MAG: flagellar basal body protein FliL [Desulfobacteraceae bacterium]|nr:MAG: flagellar basal body protein FliL [Desulfobacteraceae bacterium]
MPEEIEKDIDEGEAPSRKFSKKWILIGLAVLVIAGGGFAGWILMGGGAETSAEPAPGPEKTPKEPIETGVGKIFSMDPFVVNLNEPGGKRYLKSKIELEFAEELLAKELDSRLPQLRDVILIHLSSKTLDEIQGVDGKIELKNALVTRINQVLTKGQIRNLYFTQFVIQ